ncbi:hypothetical protein C4571_00600 [Candidatus Parcubacteria bacterium]|nr:MAG: hypothetical protein C4571_00600 [Candidatus Parcubacteria bacterium]
MTLRKLILITGASLIVLRLVFPVMHEFRDGEEYQVFHFGAERSFEVLSEGCDWGCRMDMTRTLFQVVAIATGTGALFLATRKKPLE